jgi:amidophosphoribosyltransferase
MCGIVGAVCRGSVNQSLYDGLTVLQHRGQDAAGIMTCRRDRLHLRKDNGLVRDVFETRHMLNLQGNMGIGHVRYPTAGCESSAEAQPFYVNSPYGIALAHNGNLTNAEKLKDDLFREDKRHINTESDSEDPAQRLRPRAANPAARCASTSTISSMPSPACTAVAAAAMRRSR